jgi:hypothetical protein
MPAYINPAPSVRTRSAVSMVTLGSLFYSHGRIGESLRGAYRPERPLSSGLPGEEATAPGRPWMLWMLSGIGSQRSAC